MFSSTFSCKEIEVFIVYTERLVCTYTFPIYIAYELIDMHAYFCQLM